MVERVLIHIGTEKTGSTSIQATLAANRSRLSEKGILVPESPAVDGTAWHLSLAAAFCDFHKLQDLGDRFGIHDRNEQTEFRTRVEKGLIQEIQEAGNVAQVVLSSEHLHSRVVSPAPVEQLRSFLSTISKEVRCVVYLTRQDRLAVSKASTSTRAGALMRNDVFPDVIASDGSLHPFYDYWRLWERYKSGLGHENVSVRLLRNDDRGVPDVVDDFLTLMGTDPENLERVPNRNRGLRLSPAGLKTFSRISSRYGRLANDFSAPNVFHRLADMTPGEGFRSIVTRRGAEDFAAIFETGNGLLARELGIPTLFDNDFSDYPEEVSSAEEAEAEVSELLLGLLGAVGEENARLRRQAQIFRSIVRDLPSFVDEDDPLDAPRVVDPDSTTHLEVGEFGTRVVFDQGWEEVDGEPRATASRASAWLLIANPARPRTLKIDLEIDRLGISHPDLVFELRSGQASYRAHEPRLSLEVGTGYRLIQITLIREEPQGGRRRKKADAGGDGVHLAGIELRWE